MEHSTSTPDQLRETLGQIEKMSDEDWLHSLSDRKRKELEFHDAHRHRDKEKQVDQDTYEKLYGNRKYYQATGPSRQYVSDWIDTNAPGSVFLDYACGNGVFALQAARAGAALSIGIDISSVSVANARQAAQQQGLERNTKFVQADCENTMLPTASVDLVICSGMLHHLDLSFAFPELRRILAPGGRILCVEALDYNPLIKLYRMLTPEMRTEWETAHILDLSDVRFARRFFDVGEIKYWHILSIVAPKLSNSLLPFLTKTDELLTRVPLLRLMAWIFTFELIKSRE
jgi:ubiquinone/menaquinone biosynthesis C-methylase UbiE